MSVTELLPDATFGFEAEFHTGARELAWELYGAGLLASRRLHGYHCDCGECAFDNGWALRGQSDSSCSGEFISDIQTTSRFSEFQRIVNAIQAAAFKTDAVAGTDAGFHVHVRSSDEMDLAKIGRAFILVESALMADLSPGALYAQRGFNLHAGRALMQNVSSYVSMYDSEWVRTHEDVVWGWTYASERHSNLWYSGRTGTMEFRLWNSTRSAWRMELYVRLSLLMCSDEFTDTVLAHSDPLEGLMKFVEKPVSRRNSAMRRLSDGETPFPGSLTYSELRSIVATLDSRAGELMDRQHEFHNKNKPNLKTTHTAEEYTPRISHQMLEVDRTILAGLDLSGSSEQDVLEVVLERDEMPDDQEDDSLSATTWQVVAPTTPSRVEGCTCEDCLRAQVEPEEPEDEWEDGLAPGEIPAWTRSVEEYHQQLWGEPRNQDQRDSITLTMENMRSTFGSAANAFQRTYLTLNNDFSAGLDSASDYTSTTDTNNTERNPA